MFILGISEGDGAKAPGPANHLREAMGRTLRPIADSGQARGGGVSGPALVEAGPLAGGRNAALRAVITATDGSTSLGAAATQPNPGAQLLAGMECPQSVSGDRCSESLSGGVGRLW